MTFNQFFSNLSGHPSPRNWQSELAAQSQPRSRLIRRVTGDGKTEGVLSAWLWNSVAQADCSVYPPWPRRLVWCLPMRVLVEQTVATARALVEQLPENQRPDIAVLMGGEDTEPWHLDPRRHCILIGTQDMLLSRALNRGYASGRARWPVEFGLLNQDALWVMDEVQLMDVGLATSAQLQAYRDKDASSALKPSYTWWMSATLQPDWLNTVDTAEQHPQWADTPSVATPSEREGGLWETTKSIEFNTIEAKDTDSFASLVLKKHTESEACDHGRITLVVCNTVERAVDTYKNVKKDGSVADVRLVHSRFRHAERESWRDEFLTRAACTYDTDRIIIATQVVEAGVDISATCLITELAPWPSLVQRFGRCARYGGSGYVVIVDRGLAEKTSAPYDSLSLENTLASIQSLTDVGIRSLEEYEAQLDDDRRKKLYPYEPDHLLLQGEFYELFDTTPDLTGADLDISRFIRSGEERDLQVFWLHIDKNEHPNPRQRPKRRELCSVPFLNAREWLCGKETKNARKPKLLNRIRAWIWDFIDGEWKEAQRQDLLPGRVVCVAAICGGYHEELGFDPKTTTMVNVVTNQALEQNNKNATTEADSSLTDESTSYNEWQTIAFHTQRVVDKAAVFCKDLQLSPDLSRVVCLAARWHDAGKAHPAFQGAIESTSGSTRPERPDLAKAPLSAWRAPNRSMYRFPIAEGKFEYRASLRHELASALAMFTILRIYQPDHPALLGPWKDVFTELNMAIPQHAEASSPPTQEIQAVLDLTAAEFDLLIYLIASHHGKVRVALHASPADQDFRTSIEDNRGLPIRGIRKNDILPAIAITPDGELQPELCLSLEPATMGLSAETGASWRERCENLIQRHSPTTLATLEAILRAADVHASKSRLEDPELAEVIS